MTRTLTLLSLLLAPFALTATAGAAASEWNLDVGHSHVGFTARHLAFAKVRGEFTKFSGTLHADAKTGKLTSFEAKIEAKSVDTGVNKRDDHLRSDDFFAAAKHPTITAKSKSIQWKGDKFTAIVALTIRGITKDVKFEGEQLGLKTVNFGKGAHLRTAYEASATINRKDFGLRFGGLAEGVAIVGDEVEIQIEAEASHTPTK
jgi:polyisoprenoid-binding protein YceI